MCVRSLGNLIVHAVSMDHTRLSILGGWLPPFVRACMHVCILLYDLIHVCILLYDRILLYDLMCAFCCMISCVHVCVVCACALNAGWLIVCLLACVCVRVLLYDGVCVYMCCLFVCV